MAVRAALDAGGRIRIGRGPHPPEAAVAANPEKFGVGVIRTPRGGAAPVPEEVTAPRRSGPSLT